MLVNHLLPHALILTQLPCQHSYPFSDNCFLDPCQWRSLKLVIAIKTSYLPDGWFDLEAYDSLMQMQIVNGAERCDGRPTGEDHLNLMHFDEHIMLIGRMVNCFGTSIKVKGNAGSNSTKEAILSTEQGLVVSMHTSLHIYLYHGRASEQGLVSHLQFPLTCLTGLHKTYLLWFMWFCNTITWWKGPD